MPASAPPQHSRSVADRRTCRLTCGRDRLQQRRDDDELADAGPDRSHPAVTGTPGWQGMAAPACYGEQL